MNPFTLESVVGSVPIILWAIDREGRITLSEGAGLARLGLRPGEAVGRSAFEMYADFPVIGEHLREALSGRVFTHVEEVGEVAFETHYAPLRDKSGAVIGAQGLSVDVSAARQAENDLRAVRCELETRVAERTLELEQANEKLRCEVAQRQQAEAAARDQSQLLQSIVDSLGEGVAVANAEGEMTFMNAEGARIVGVPLTGSSAETWSAVAGLYLPDEVTPFPTRQLPLVRAMHGETVDGVEIAMRLPGATESTWLSVNARPLGDASEARQGGVAVFRDITRRKHTEAALTTTERRLEAILDNTPAVVYMKDTQGAYQFINRAYETLFHVSRARMTGKTDFDLFPADIARQFRDNDLAVLQAGQPIQFEEVAPHDDGPHTYVSAKFALHDAQGKVSAVCGISTDITARKRAEENLRAEQKFLQQLIRAHERDRQLMAYEIHDGLIQDITGAVLHLEGINWQQPGSERTRASFDVALRALRQALGEGRRLLSGLRPPILDEAGIIAAIEYLIAEYSQPGDLAIAFHHEVRFDRLDPLLEGTIFRIVQESLTNVRRHSGAERAEVRLVQRGDRLKLTVVDDGVGFEPAPEHEQRFGLQGIRKRAVVVGGQAEIRSTLGQGTTVEVAFPLISPED